MSQQTWVGSDYVSSVLLNSVPSNDTELYNRVEVLENNISSIVDSTFPDQTGKVGYTLQTNGTLPQWVDARVVVMFEYEDRSILRTTVRADKALAIVESLGLFVFREGSEEPDDDESCFATSTGRWLLEAPHWDVINTWTLPEREDTETRISTIEDYISITRVLYGTATCTVSSVSAVSSTSFTGTVTGAEVGDRVLVVPPNQLGSTAANTGRLSYHAFISSANTVSIYLCNASAATATTNTSIRTAWPVMVFKEI